MNSKIHFRNGDIEISYEGEQDFIEEKFIALFTKITGIQNVGNINKVEKTNPLTKGNSTQGISAWSISTFAQKLKSKSTTELTLAAGIKLTLVDGIAHFNRSQLLGEIQMATGIYKKSMSTNLSKSLKVLTDNNSFLPISGENYALESETLNSIKVKLAI